MSRDPWGASWSGGKDSCLACWRGLQAGAGVRWLVNFSSQTYRRVRFHGVTEALIARQAAATGIELFQKPTRDAMDGYERGFREGVTALRERGMTHMVFGDIHLDEHREWVERVCSELGVRAVEPLWGDDPVDLLGEFVDAGFRALVVSAMGEHFGPEILGREVDHALIDELVARGDVDPCGENGEYHTFVFDGPVFAWPVEFERHEPVQRNGHWFLDIRAGDTEAAEEANAQAHA